VADTSERMSLEAIQLSKSGVDWTDYAINFWYGCVEASTACLNCYARTMTERFSESRFGGATWGRNGVRSPYENADRKAWSINERAAKIGHSLKVFSNDMSDFFEDHPTLPPFRAAAWDIIRANKNIDWLLLTKRANLIRGFLPEDFFGGDFRHVHLGVTCESVDLLWRVDELRAIPEWGGLRWISYEPAIGPLHQAIDLTGISWLIYGGESCADNSRRRDDSDAWAYGIMELCRQNEVAFFYKQNSGRPGHLLTTLDGVEIHNYPRFR